MDTLTVVAPANGRITVPSHWAGKRVTVRLGRDMRSNQQLRWIKGVALPILAEHLGYDLHEREDLHEQCLGAAFGWRETRDGRIVPAKRTGDLSFRTWLRDS